LLANDTDPNGLPLSITGVGNPTNGTVSFDAGTQTVLFAPTANYAGPASFTYTVSDGQSAPASANVSLTVNALAPVARNDNGFVTGRNTAVSITGASLIANDTDPNGLPMSIAGVSDPAHGTVAYDAASDIITFAPQADYAGTAMFTYSITDANGAVSSARASLMITDPATTSLFDPATGPSTITENDPNAVELGLKFTASSDGEITGLRFYKGEQNIGTHTANLWNSTGTLMASEPFADESPSGWQQVDFASPVQITAGTMYVASYHTDGNYSADANFFDIAHTNGPLTAPSSAESGGNGVYAYGGTSLFPTSSFNSTSYGVDILFKPQLVS
jgi:hypothetical protein